MSTVDDGQVHEVPVNNGVEDEADEENDASQEPGDTDDDE